ncbi:hypothetical protein IX39_04525 [Chryseobacterium formosense]|uniref:Lipoprotein n=1 Tax=Chryseobacterium formosense TaxID=236814 RepID=A0A085Z657_9FLAO|nr:MULTISPECIES: hypothetical protein [Chryseobacterium]KFE99920.1 hypothetical protein IX39_04525 [Chryseobacterium formosense]OCK53220.1 hypothetical protein BA768_01300 [Chryseobacterium sp. CBo1]SFT60021.1 hypothetical protein SAMN05421857_1989 [Chryseobacterium formosense]
MNSKIFLSVLILIIFTACKSAYINSSKNIMHGGASKSVNLYAFVGKKISITEFDPNENNDLNKTFRYEVDEETGDSVKVISKRDIMDGAFKCKYQVLRKMFNYLDSDTIEFIAYDHYGTPGFAEKDSVILYLSKSKDGSHYFHQKYQYDQVYRNRKGNYYSYPKFSGNESPETIKGMTGFDKTFSDEKYDVSQLNPDVIKMYYPPKFYKIENNFAIPIKAIYLNRLTNYRLSTTFKDL